MGDVDYEGLFNALPGPHMVLRADDPYFTLIAENEAHARLISPDTLIYSVGKAFLEAYPDTSDEFARTGTSPVLESIRRVIATGKPDSMPDIRYDLAEPNGTFRERWWRATHYPLKDASGAVVSILQQTNDITDELVSRRRLEQTQAQLDLARAIGLVSSFNWDIKKDIVTGDSNLAATFGVTPEDAIKGLPIDRFIASIYEEDRERVGQAIQAALGSEGGVYEEEYRTYHHDMTVGWVIARGAVLRGDGGKPERFIGILVDITDRKNAENELADTKRMFDALFNSTVVSVALARTDGDVLEANKTFLKTFGYTKADLKKGLNTRILTAASSHDVTRELYDALEKSGEARPMEKTYVRKDGSSFTALVGAARLPESPDQFIAFILDVSENRRLRELNAAKDEFIALASHQLRTPATAVKQYLGLILEGYAGDVDPTHREYLQTAYESNERELQIINDLLKTAQLDTRGFAIKPKKTNVVTLIDDIVAGVTPVCEQKHQRITFSRDTELFAHVDEDETRIVLSNLIENAHKYSPENTTIFITATRAGDNVSITVRDQGVGIASDDIESIFEKFTRVNNPLSDGAAGNGLGLYWVKRIVTLHGGRLDVASEVGKGTTFMVELPA